MGQAQEMVPQGILGHDRHGGMSEVEVHIGTEHGDSVHRHRNVGVYEVMRDCLSAAFKLA